MLNIEDLNMTVHYRTEIKTLFVYLHLCLNVILYSIHVYLHSYPLLLMTIISMTYQEKQMARVAQ
jgi:uncharacterized integral membrane protein